MDMMNVTNQLAPLPSFRGQTGSTTTSGTNRL
jgi:hypothetical protein